MVGLSAFMKKYPQLRLDNQLCFPLYACSKEIVRMYKPILDPLDLTYTQYLVMMVLWEKESINIKDLGRQLFLDSGTLTPVVKKLEAKGYISRNRCADDERCVIVNLTKEGEKLAESASDVPCKMSQCALLDEKDSKELARILHKMMGKIAVDEASAFMSK